jgi:hypothetical protein
VQEWHRRDKELDRQFRDSIKEVTGGAIDGDTFKAVTALYKLRNSGNAAPSGHSRRPVKQSTGGAEELDLAFDPFNSLASTVTETSQEADARARRQELQPLSKLDCPESFDPDANKALFDRLNKLRTAKIESELMIRDETAKFTEMNSQHLVLRGRMDAARAAVEKAEMDRERLLQARELAGANLELLIRVKQGQDEMESDTVVTDYSDAVVIPRSIVESVNGDIVKLGTERVSILTKMKDFKKLINFQKWEEEFLHMQARSQEEHYTDLHMLRVTKELQTLIKGGEFAAKQKKELEKVGVLSPLVGSSRQWVDGVCVCACVCSSRRRETS